MFFKHRLICWSCQVFARNSIFNFHQKIPPRIASFWKKNHSNGKIFLLQLEELFFVVCFFHLVQQWFYLATSDLMTHNSSLYFIKLSRLENLFFIFSLLKFTAEKDLRLDLLLTFFVGLKNAYKTVSNKVNSTRVKYTTTSKQERKTFSVSFQQKHFQFAECKKNNKK